MVSQKISEFNVSTSLNNSDLFTFVVNGTNKNIAYSNFKADLGVTGSLSQAGDPLGAPILDVVSSNEYNIRNLESSKGILASVSAQNGVVVGANFAQQNAVGAVNIIEDLNSKQYNFRGIKAVEPIEVSIDDDGFIVFEESESPLAQTNTVIVSDITDFPTAVGDVITLEDNINYIIVQGITTDKRFVCGANNHITSNNPFSPVLTYTGTDTFFTCLENSFLMTYIAISAPTGKIWDISSPLSAVTFGIDVVTVLACDSVGTFDDLRSFNVTNLGVFSANEGITVTGTTNWAVFSANKVRIESTSATFVGIDFTTSVHEKLDIVDPIINGPAGAVAITGLTASGNITPTLIGSVMDGEFFGGITPLTNITSKDVRWEFRGNTGVNDTISDALIHTSANALVTTITSIGVGVKVNAVFVDDDISRFTSDSTGRLDYVGERAARLPIDITGTILSTGGDKQVEICIAINGVVVSATCVGGTASGSKAAALTCIWQHDFQPGDYVEAYVSNQSTTDNLTVTQAVIRVN